VSAAAAKGSEGASDESVPAVPVERLSYTEASRELDAIVDFFEQREVDVDVLVARLERATALIDELDRRLRQTRAQVEDLVPRLDKLAGDVGGGGEAGGGGGGGGGADE
jgi:exodeoxyribonuclease VII small subunit